MLGIWAAILGVLAVWFVLRELLLRRVDRPMLDDEVSPLENLRHNLAWESDVRSNPTAPGARADDTPHTR